MGLALTSREIDALKSLPPLPSAPELSGGKGPTGGDAAIDFSEALEKFRRDTAAWRSRLIANRRKIADLMAAAAASQDEEVLVFLRDEVLPVLIGAMDATVAEIRCHIEPSPKSQRQMALIAAVSRDLDRVIRRERKRYREAVSDHYNAAVELYYGLLGLQADYDPDARGGTTFENADDLIASLRS